MKDALYPLVGSGSSLLGMIIGIIDVHSLLNAFVVGAVGALGGFFFKLIKELIIKLWFRIVNDIKKQLNK